MLKKEDFVVIKARVQRGVYQKDIAAELGVHPKTVSRALSAAALPLVSANLAAASSTPSSPSSTFCSQKV